MKKTFFIDSDEEIISVIGHLRKSSEVENDFVFPKRSLVLQSAISLRLLQREAEKQRKKISIISQDEPGRQLAERVGIPTKDYASEIGTLRQEQQSSLLRPSSPQGSPSPSLRPSQNMIDGKRVNPLIPEANRIGSDSFSSDIPTDMIEHQHSNPSEGEMPPLHERGPKRSTFPPQETGTSGQRLRIRDMTPRYQTMLNSQRKTPQPSSESSSALERIEDRPKQTQNALQEDRSAQSDRGYASHDPAGRNQKLQKFFQNKPVSAEHPISLRNAPGMQREDIPQKSRLPDIRSNTSRSTSKTMAYVFGSSLLLAGVGAAIYFLVPKATVTVVPHDISRNIEAKYDGRTIAPIGDSDSSVVPVRKIEKTYTVKVTANTTGKSSSGNQKARGTIVISNEYSSDSQPLISTTRFETSEGKIFRLAESITVPGMTLQGGKREPGVIEAVVIADEAGDSYNIAPSTFTIPGFKGSSKFDKFHAKSTKDFTGGGDGNEGISNITKEDIDKALQKLKESSKEEFIASVKQELLPEERIIEEAVEISDDDSPALPLIGSIGTSFDVEEQFSGKVFVVSEKALEEKLSQKGQPEIQGVTFDVTGATLSFENVIPHYDENSLEFTVRATLLLESVIMKDALREELLGQNEEGIKTVLEKHPEIKKIEVNFNPEFLFRTIPNSTSRVSIVLKSDH